MTFSEKLITLRAGRGWSQERLAEELGVTRQAVGRWEKGAGLPDSVGLTRLAAVFDVAPEWLLDEAARPARGRRFDAEAAGGISGRTPDDLLRLRAWPSEHPPAHSLQHRRLLRREHRLPPPPHIEPRAI